MGARPQIPAHIQLATAGNPGPHLATWAGGLLFT
jgi:hypothetical protein